MPGIGGSAPPSVSLVGGGSAPPSVGGGVTPPVSLPPVSLVVGGGIIGPPVSLPPVPLVGVVPVPFVVTLFMMLMTWVITSRGR